MNRSGTRNYAITQTHGSLSSRTCAQFGSLHLKDVPEVQNIQSRGVGLVMAELLVEQDRTLQAGNGTTKGGDLQNNGGLKKVERGKPSLPMQGVSDEGSRYKTQTQKTEAFFTQCIIRLQKVLLQGAVAAKLYARKHTDRA